VRYSFGDTGSDSFFDLASNREINWRPEAGTARRPCLGGPVRIYGQVATEPGRNFAGQGSSRATQFPQLRKTLVLSPVIITITLKCVSRFNNLRPCWIGLFGPRRAVYRSGDAAGDKKELSMTFNKLNQFIQNLNLNESGQDLLEYALVLLAVLVAVIAGSTNLSSVIKAELSRINTSITGLSLP
jgi:Flp pilus assembly pilin Flp